ncbi:MAG: DEAD/DEAH box helicase [Thiopseudomonas sp.]
MSFIKTIRSLLGGHEPADTAAYQITVNSDGLLYAALPETYAALESGRKISVQHTVLKMLLEQGLASQIPNGFLLPRKVVCAQLGEADADDAELASILHIQPRQKLLFRSQVRSITTKTDFAIDLFVSLPGQEECPVLLHGPYVQLPGDQQVRLNTGELVGLEAWQKHQNLSPNERSEIKNLQLIAQLQLAKDSGMDIDLRHFERFAVQVPDNIGVHVQHNQDGSLTLRPSIASLSNEQLESRWGQMTGSDEEGVLRVENTIVLLDQRKCAAIKEVFRNERIPKEQVKTFIENPSAFLDASLVDLDVGFSTRVTGIGELVFIAFGELDSEKTNWFSDTLVEQPMHSRLAEVIKCQEDLDRFTEQYQAAQTANATVMQFDGHSIDISHDQHIGQQLTELTESFTDSSTTRPSHERNKTKSKTDANANKKWTLLLETEKERNSHLLKLASTVLDTGSIDWQNSRREPYAHQRQGVEWATSLLHQAVATAQEPVRIQGALLADDMGLGKTYMSLMAINEYYRLQEEQNKTLKPILVVAPLSLLDNWADEVEATFKESPFTDIKILQSGRDLSAFRVAGVQRESVQLSEQTRPDSDETSLPEIKYALHVGKEAGPKRLDMPKRLVIATYDTLRSYQFSLCKVDWGIVFFDEAQNIKNPNTLQTRAAKALKADFKMLVTGTPVENSLADFWCLLDTAQPGLLGEWPVFRENWVTPIVKAPEDKKARVRQEIGEKLRAATGRFMLRRTKEDELPGLPQKQSFVGTRVDGSTVDIEVLDFLANSMRGNQLSRYDDVLSDYQLQRSTEGKGAALTALAALRNISLHPALVTKSDLSAPCPVKAKEFIADSAKVTALKHVLDRIQEKSEKVIIFAINKRFQLMLKQTLDVAYGLNIDIINGDTKTVETSQSPESSTRKGMIASFEARPGFNIIIMSPIAAGVGLTIIGANHVVHLERHWNPAKEAQATDRVYRIGQTKDVCVYYPFSLHPSKPSFDEHLAILLNRKQLLKEAVVTTEAVKEAEIIRNILGT